MSYVALLTREECNPHRTSVLLRRKPPWKTVDTPERVPHNKLLNYHERWSGEHVSSLPLNLEMNMCVFCDVVVSLTVSICFLHPLSFWRQQADDLALWCRYYYALFVPTRELYSTKAVAASHSEPHAGSVKDVICPWKDHGRLLAFAARVWVYIDVALGREFLCHVSPRVFFIS